MRGGIMKLKDLADYLENYLDEVENVICDLFEEQEQDYRLWLEPIVIHFPEYNIKIREGLCETWNVDSQEYETDYIIHMFFDADTNERLNLERGGFNFSRLRSFLSLDLSDDELLNLSCEVHFI